MAGPGDQTVTDKAPKPLPVEIPRPPSPEALARALLRSVKRPVRKVQPTDRSGLPAKSSI